MLRTRPNALQKHEGSSCQQEQKRSLANHCMCPQVLFFCCQQKATHYWNAEVAVLEADGYDDDVVMMMMVMMVMVME